MNSAVSILTIASIYTVLVEVISHEHLRIIGGHSDIERQFSWIVFLLKNDDNQGRCTGSLISPVWVLSAAHCTAAGERVYLFENGQTFSPEVMDQLQYSRVMLIITHEKFTLLRVAGTNDIALYKITATTIPKYGKLSAIDYRSLAGREVSVMGFGRDKWYSALEDKMNWNTSFSVASGLITQCDQSDKVNLKAATKPIICIVRPCGEVGLVAPGDSGGPVVYDGSIVGINSYGPAQKLFNAFIPHTTVSVYTIYACPISIHLDWIQKMLLDNK